MEQKPTTSTARDISGFKDYSLKLNQALVNADWQGITELTDALRRCWKEGRQVFLCGNGGSAGNAMHIANDLIYGVDQQNGIGLRAEALSSNVSVITCFANDIGYDSIYSHQLAVKGQAGDLLISLSGSGNSPNIVKAIKQAKVSGVKSFSILGFDGGAAKDLSDVAIHFPVDDMQIAEDLQLIVAHMITQAIINEESKSFDNNMAVMENQFEQATPLNGPYQ